MGSKRVINANYFKLAKRNKKIYKFGQCLPLLEILKKLRAIVGNKANTPRIITTNIQKEIEITSVLPEEETTFPWGGHLGIRSYSSLLKILDKNKSTLLFTNTRNQSERWYQCLKFCLPEMEEKIALHHGSLDKDERKIVEDGVKNGLIKWVVCTSSLDLGIDFQPVDQIVQIGSAKNLARLIKELEGVLIDLEESQT